MSKAALGALFFACSLLTGCAGVVSLHPLINDSDSDAAVEPGILGQWREVSPDDKPESANGQIYTVERAEKSGYKLTTLDNGVEKSGVFHLLKLKDRYLVDVRDDVDDPPLPCHIYFSLVLQKDSLKLSEMDTPWLKDQIAHRQGLHTEELTEPNAAGKIVITSPHDDLRKYFLPLASDSRSFANESELRRVK